MLPVYPSQEKAAERGIALDAPVHPVCKRYIDLLASLPEQPYFVLASCLWAIEYVYNQAWQVWWQAAWSQAMPAFIHNTRPIAGRPSPCART